MKGLFYLKEAAYSLPPKTRLSIIKSGISVTSYSTSNLPGNNVTVPWADVEMMDTNPILAAAMADQWGGYALQERNVA